MSRPRGQGKAGTGQIEPRALDLFGEVLITKHDVYAWLLAVVDLDPASERAAGYIRNYGVVEKIARAKQEGIFDALTATAQDSARYRELIDHTPTVTSSGNVAGAGEWAALQVKPLAKPTRAPRRTKEVIESERAQRRREKAIRKQLTLSMLCRLPKWTPSLSAMLEDIGKPRAEHLAMAMNVHADTARRWIREDEAPQAVMLALYWVTRWGASAADANAYNDAAMSASLARSRQQEVTMLQEQVAHIERIADFGSANDPLLQVSSKLAAAHRHIKPVTPALIEATSPALESPAIASSRRAHYA